MREIKGLAKTSLVLCLLFIQSSLLACAQQAPAGACDIPVVVTRFDTAYQDLDARDFVVRLGTAPIALESASVDRGPKRVALLLDASRYVPDDEWKFETGMAIDFVAHARTYDRFALLILGRESATQGFLSPAEAKDRLRALWSSRPSRTDSGEQVYDGILAAAKGFDPPEFGDALVLIGHMTDVGSKTDPDRLLELVMKNRLRFFGFDFSDPLPVKLPPNFDPSNIAPESSAPQKLMKMTAETGYRFGFDPMENLNRPGQMSIFESSLDDVYRRIAEPYRLRLRASGAKSSGQLDISVANSEVRKIRSSDLYYPQSISPCATASTVAP